jgi:hypothetical protein
MFRAAGVDILSLLVDLLSVVCAWATLNARLAATMLAILVKVDDVFIVELPKLIQEKLRHRTIWIDGTGVPIR